MIDVVVRDAGGIAVRNLVTDGSFAPILCDVGHSITWDARDDVGAPVPDGTYTIEFSATDASGLDDPAPTDTLVLTRHVRNISPGHMTFPKDGDVVSEPATFVFQRTPGFDTHFPFFRLRWFCTPVEPFTIPIAEVRDPAPGNTPLEADANLRPCPREATIRLGVSVLDPFGWLHGMFQTAAVTVEVQEVHRFEIGLGQAVEGDGGTTELDVPITMAEPSTEEVRVLWQADSGTGTSRVDWDNDTGEVVFAPGETESSIRLLVRGDTTPEPDELAFVHIVATAGAIPTGGFFGFGFGLILDDDSGPRARAGTARVDEGDAGTTTLSIPVTLSEASDDPVSVEWTTRDNSARTPSDFAAATGTLTFAPGETEGVITLTVNGDTAVEPDELALVALTGATTASVGGWLNLGFGWIDNDD